ncbi:putative phosphoglycerate mutase [Friedmanniella endophytica]|uniref:Putative phosphoglycerate mutase n=1 Tax=Microlunatus kandeliicorticis TaxID=1759536 RepID=A0A7W3ISK9_9ACTN|nr:histidine phosphatase family protein [Microlunatus kandeliicorticis]MBA8794464.1 putative phosphoglycerate mutase [Microlunatus kandeliicorticis]
MTDVWLVRHGETEWSRDGRHTSVTDLPLTPAGEAEARRLAGHLDPNAFGLVLSSPRQRARRTAELAGFVGDHAPRIDEDLAEWNYGDYEGRSSATIHEHDPGWTIWPHGAPGGETPDDVRARLDRLIARLRGSGVEQVLCFAHGHILRAMTLVWLGLDLELGEHFPLATATVSVLGDVKDGVPALERWNSRP